MPIYLEGPEPSPGGPDGQGWNRLSLNAHMHTPTARCAMRPRTYPTLHTIGRDSRLCEWGGQWAACDHRPGGDCTACPRLVGPIRPLCVSATVTTVMVRVYEPDRVDDLLPGGIPAQLRICVRDNGGDGDWNAAAVWTWEELARLTGAGWKVGRQFHDHHGPGFWLHRAIGSEWAAAWPDAITLDRAAEEIDFDLFDDDDPSMVLVKGRVPVADVAAYSYAELAGNDTQDRFEPLEAALAAGAREVPPVVVLPGEGLRDGHHRAALAQMAGLTTIPAYLPRTEGPSQ